MTGLRAIERLETLGPRLRARRQAMAITQEQLAERAGVTVTTVSRVETSVVHPDLPTLAALLDALGCEFGDVLGAPAPDEPTPDERQMIGRMRTMSEEHRDLLMRLAAALV